MKRPALPIALMTVLAVALSSVTCVQAQSQPAKKTEPASKPVASRTGCLDEQDGRYVLVDDHDLKVVASLEADGFPADGFAKHVGQKVTLRGISIPSGTHPVFRVRSIETVSETCAPDKTQQGKI